MVLIRVLSEYLYLHGRFAAKPALPNPETCNIFPG